MQSAKAFNIYLLTLLILIGSILNVHVHSDQISESATETTKEIESSSAEKNEFSWPQEFLHMHSFFVNEVAQISLPISRSQNIFTTPQLLDANRIALPPPSLS